MKTEVIITGTGQRNGVVIINKTLILDRVVSSQFQGSKKEASVLKFIEKYYPRVKVKVNNLSINTRTIS